MKDKSCKLYLLPAGLLISILHSAMVPEVLSIDTNTSSAGPTPKSTDPSPVSTVTPENPRTTNKTGSSDMSTILSATTNAVTPLATSAGAMTPIATTTAATTIAYSAQKCRSFKCTGLNCFVNEVNATLKLCRLGISHCELQKVVGSGNTISYEGGCSNTCATSKSSCTSIQNANCFQECCNATKTGCCMILDGQVHFNTAMDMGSIVNLFSLALIVIFTSHFFSSI